MDVLLVKKKRYQYGINMCNKNMYHNVTLIFKMLK